MLRIAVPNKGSLADQAMELLTRSGYRLHRPNRELAIVDHANGVEFFFLRPRDIALYVGSGTLAAGVTGRDLLADSDAAAEEILPLGFAHSQFRFAAPAGGPGSVAELTGRRVATSYPSLVRKYLANAGVDADLVVLDGAVENAVQLGIADAVADVVETGTSLQNSGLVAFGDPIMESEAILIRSSTPLTPQVADAVTLLRQRVQGVLIARRYVMLDYDCPQEALDAACALTPGVEGPTVSPMARPGWSAVRALVIRDEAPFVMDKLWQAGARAILVTSLESSRI
jgi:ATP phosphoribosyltransferase